MNENFNRTTVNSNLLRHYLGENIADYCSCKGIEYLLNIVSILVQMMIQGEGFYIPAFSGIKPKDSMIDHSREYRLIPVDGSENLCYMAFLSQEDLLKSFPLVSYVYMSLTEIYRELKREYDCDDFRYRMSVYILCIKNSWGDEFYLWPGDIETIFNIVLQVVSGLGIRS